MTKADVAKAYFPHASVATAQHHLRSWIARCKPLAAALIAAGHKPQQHYYTAAQLDILQYYLAEPYDDLSEE